MGNLSFPFRQKYFWHFLVLTYRFLIRVNKYIITMFWKVFRVRELFSQLTSHLEEKNYLKSNFPLLLFILLGIEKNEKCERFFIFLFQFPCTIYIISEFYKLVKHFFIILWKKFEKVFLILLGHSMNEVRLSNSVRLLCSLYLIKSIIETFCPWW